jgi:CubicO group peptidase (beta-lactamase class C family)
MSKLHQNQAVWAALDAALQGYVDQGKVAGMVTLVQQCNSLVYSAARGTMDVDTGTPMQPDTICRIASLTKPVTAAAVMMLVEEGLLSLDDPVARFIPAFDEMTVLVDAADREGARVPLERPITVKHLITHTSGLPMAHFEGVSIEALPRAVIARDLPPEKMTDKVTTLPLEFQPGSAWRYYDLNFDTLGRLVELASGMTFDGFLHDKVFEPLSMHDTGFYVPPPKRDRLAAAYQNPEAGSLKLTESIEAASVLTEDFPPYGGWGLASTARDYLRFMVMLRNGGTLEGVRILAP